MHHIGADSAECALAARGPQLVASRHRDPLSDCAAVAMQLSLDDLTTPRGLTRAELMTSREVAELLDVPVSTVLEWGRNGTAPARETWPARALHPRARRGGDSRAGASPPPLKSGARPTTDWSARLVRWELETGACSAPNNDETRLPGRFQQQADEGTRTLDLLLAKS